MAKSSILNWIIKTLEVIDKTLLRCDEKKKEIESQAIEIMNGSKSSSRCNAVVQTSPIQKKHFKDRRFQRRSNSFEEDSHYDKVVFSHEAIQYAQS